MTGRTIGRITLAGFAVALLGAGGGTLAQAPQAALAQNTSEQDKAAVRQAAYDYGEGYYEGAADRMERALHPALVKRGLISREGSAAILVPMNAETLIEATRLGGGNKLPADKRNISYALLDMREDVASAKIFTTQFNDYLHFVKVGGKWRLVNVLWQPPSPGGAANAEADKAAIAQVFKDYFETATAGDVARFERVTHPEAALRSFGPVGPGRFIVREGNRESFAEAVRLKKVQLPPNPVVTVLDLHDNIASVMVTAGSNVSYWHLARQNGQWRTVNRLSR